MQRAENLVTGQCGTNLTNHHGIRILSENRAQAGCKGESSTRLHRNLRDSGKFVFHRVFDCEDFFLRREDASKNGVERCGLAATGWAGGEKQPVGLSTTWDSWRSRVSSSPSSRVVLTRSSSSLGAAARSVLSRTSRGRSLCSLTNSDGRRRRVSGVSSTPANEPFARTVFSPFTRESVASADLSAPGSCASAMPGAAVCFKRDGDSMRNKTASRKKFHRFNIRITTPRDRSC